MAPAVEKAIQFCLIAALPIGGCLGWLTGELIGRTIIAKYEDIEEGIFKMGIPHP
jgi:hypothetical protein